MENPVTTLKVKCIQAGTNLSEVCRVAGVDRTVVDRWQRKLPKSFQTLEQLNAALEQIIATKNKPTA